MTIPQNAADRSRASSSELSELSIEENKAPKTPKTASKKRARSTEDQIKPKAKKVKANGGSGGEAKKAKAGISKSASNSKKPTKKVIKGEKGATQAKTDPVDATTLAASAILHEDSDLSDIESDIERTKKQASSKAAPKKKATKVAKEPKEKKAKKANGETKKQTKAAGKMKEKAPKGTSKDKKTKEAEPRDAPKPKPRAKKPEVIPEPPIFEKVVTRLGHEEAEQRMALREFLWRFRQILSIPERSLPALDDFDRPITESNVRLISGALLDVIKDELEASKDENDEDLKETLFNFREELRYYADVPRFASIFQSLTEPLGLELPPAPFDGRAQANEAALRSLFDLGDDQPAPAWATELSVPSRRGASRMPQPSEVVRMLLALVERTLTTPKIKNSMESFAFETQVRKEHANLLKKEQTAWEKRKQKLQEERLLCKTAAETKANVSQTTKESREHNLRVAQYNTNMRAGINQMSLRFEPLGTDLDGRIYYALSHRPVENDTKAPIGWGTGILIWGPAVAGKVSGDDNLPHSIERWSHFGKSKDVKPLVKWLEWRYKKAMESAKLNGIATTTLDDASPNGMLTQPTSQLASHVRSQKQVRHEKDDDASSASSGLTPPPKSSREEMMALINPHNYTPSAETLEDRGKSLISRLGEVAEWLEVLEWKGLGEP
ncbi:hypothetical protein C366_02470 [Cryptococcus neoformans Tu401-1]|nr:hypothetical protein C366_02470 [Cryptococcus neoformans var. grubii Tu401-1]OXM80124.1 hypothetical protein C364_02432 [Cryptococcus neoformans var. grubii Bt63]